METIMHKGKVYQIGKGYLCSTSGRYGVLASSGRAHLHMDSENDRWHTTELTSISPELVGTIEDASIELEDGEWYMFAAGVCVFSNGAFRKCVGSSIYFTKYQVTPLCKMVKAES